MNVLAIVIFILILWLSDIADKRITLRIKDRLGDSWKKPQYRFFIIAIHLLIFGIALTISICVSLLISGSSPQIWPILKIVLVFLTIIFTAAMFVGSVLWFFRALANENKGVSADDVYHSQMKMAFLLSFLFAISSVVLLLEYRFLI